ncbi:hypothetical protein LguiA_031209 [Lonicera macranthoides]
MVPSDTMSIVLCNSLERVLSLYRNILANFRAENQLSVTTIRLNKGNYNCPINYKISTAIIQNHDIIKRN